MFFHVSCSCACIYVSDIMSICNSKIWVAQSKNMKGKAIKSLDVFEKLQNLQYGHSTMRDFENSTYCRAVKCSWTMTFDSLCVCVCGYYVLYTCNLPTIRARVKRPFLRPRLCYGAVEILLLLFVQLIVSRADNTEEKECRLLWHIWIVWQ